MAGRCSWIKVRMGNSRSLVEQCACVCHGFYRIICGLVIFHIAATWTKREGQRVGIPIIWLFPDKRFGSDVSNTYNLHRKVAHCIGFQIKTQYM